MLTSSANEEDDKETNLLTDDIRPEDADETQTPMPLPPIIDDADKKEPPPPQAQAEAQLPPKKKPLLPVDDDGEMEITLDD